MATILTTQTILEQNTHIKQSNIYAGTNSGTEDSEHNNEYYVVVLYINYDKMYCVCAFIRVSFIFTCIIAFHKFKKKN